MIGAMIVFVHAEVFHNQKSSKCMIFVHDIEAHFRKNIRKPKKARTNLF